jgi:signal transduction histidine kinase
MRLSIATKIFLVFTALVVLFTGVLMFSTYRTETLYGRIQRLNETVVPISLLLSDVQTDLKSFNVVLNERDPLVLRRTLQMTRLVYFLPDRFTQTLQRARELAEKADLEDIFGTNDPARTPEAANLESRLAELHGQALEFARQSTRFTRLVLDDKPRDNPSLHAKRRMELQARLGEQARKLDQEITALRSDLRTRTDMALARANDRQRSSLYALGGLSALALLVAVGLLIAVLFTVRPLTTLTAAARRIGEGDYRPIEGILERRRGSDEITMLTREFNSMAESLAERDARLREQHQRLLKSERLATVGRMTSLITHELRNPLSSINLNSEMLQEALFERGIKADDREIVPLLETIVAEVDRLRDITEEYLVYARLPSPNFEPNGIADIAESLIDFHQFEWSQAGVAVELSVTGPPPQVMVDANQLRQALLNLIRNAVEASGPDSEIQVRISSRAARAVVEIRDHGPGIPAERRDRIFEPFFTTKSHGTGLGLAMTQQIIEEHHGGIDVQSEEGHGTTFVIKLPLRVEAVETTESA